MRAPLPFLLLCCLLFACAPEFGVPGDAHITCDAVDDCPEPYTCVLAIHRCVLPEDIDGTAPAVTGEISVAPAFLGKDMTATVTFEVDEDLDKTPLVTVQLPNAVGLQYQEALSTKRKFVFTYRAGGSEPQNVDCPVEVVLTDKSENSSRTTARQPLRFDFVAPAVGTATLSGSPAKSDGVVQLFLRASEALKEAPVVRLPENRTFTQRDPPDTAGPNEYFYEYTVLDSDASGVWQVTADLVDPMGNRAVGLVVGSLTVDRQPPGFEGTPVLSPPVARTKSFVQLTFMASEDLSGTPSALFGVTPMVAAGSEGRLYHFTHQVTDADGDGTIPISVQLVDLAGNVADFFGLHAEVDDTAPVAGAPTVLPARVGGSATVAAEFDLPEEGVEVIGVYAGALNFARDPKSTGAHAVYAYTTKGTETEGLQTVVADLRDAAGNTNSVTLGTFFLDLTAPHLTAKAIDRTFAGPNGAVVVTFTTSEELSENPVLTADWTTWSLTTHDLNSYTYTGAIQASAIDGPVSVTVQIVDLAGNPASEQAGTFTIDTQAPAIANAVLAPPVVRQRAMLEAEFDASEPLGADPRVLVGGAAMAKSSQSGQHYVYAYVADGTEGASGPVTVELTDLAGNTSAPLPAGTAHFDFQAPRVVTAKIVPAGPFRSPQGAEPDIQVSVTFSTDEPLAGMQGTVGAVPLACPVPQPTQKDFVCTFAVPRNRASKDPDEGLQAIQVDVTDAAGNGANAQLGDAIFDFTSPAIASAEVSYTPGPDNPLGLVARATVGTTVFVSVVSSEPLLASATPKLDASLKGVPAPFAFTRLSQSSAGATFKAVVPAKTADGAYELEATLTDLAGNVGTSRAATTTVGVKTALPIFAVDQAKVLYLRSPWGNSSSESLGTRFIVPRGPYFALAPAEPLADEATLPAATFTLDGGVSPSRVRVWSSADPAGRLLLGDMAPNVDQTWDRLTLSAIDVPYVYVSGIDDAGNESAAVALKYNEWVATPNPPLAGDSPHVLFGTRHAEARLQPTPAAVVTAAGLGGRDGTAQQLTSVPLWLPRGGSATLPARNYSAAVWDSARGRVVVFGGETGAGKSNEVWEWDGANWANRSPALGVSPPARSEHAMAYDAARGRTVVFGGAPAGAANGTQDTWEWNGTSWTELTPATRPPARLGHRMVYDGARGRIVLFGGRSTTSSATPRADTWEWDGTAWKDVTPAVSPPARHRHAMAYDSARDRVIVAMGSGPSALQDVWEWNGALRTWTNATPASGSLPSARYSTAMAYDPGLQRTFLFGGERTSYPTAADDLWEWSGTGWTSLGTTSFARYWHGAAYDGSLGGLLFLGGDPGSSMLPKPVLMLRGRTLARAEAAEPPAPNEPSRMAYFPERKTVEILTNGSTATPSATTMFASAWTGAAWNAKVSTTIPNRIDAAFAYLGNGHALLFGGTNQTTYATFQDTWDWDGTSAVQKSPTTSPSARAEAGMAYLGVSGQALLFGGRTGSGYNTAVGDTWTWDGANWVQKAPLNKPAPRFGHRMAYSDHCACVILQGGRDATQVFTDTWSYYKGAWTDVSPLKVRPTAPYSTWDLSLVYAPNLDRFLSFVHAETYPNVYDESWLFGGMWSGSAWSSTAWAVRPSAGLAGPPTFKSLGVAFDTDRSKLMAYGYNSITGMKKETYEWDADSARAPAVQFEASASLASFPVSSATRLRVRAFAGGSGGKTGAALFGWTGWETGSTGGRWSSLTSNASAASTGVLDWTTTSPSIYLQERDRTWYFQLRPVSGPATLTDEATLTADYVEVRVRYPGP